MRKVIESKIDNKDLYALNRCIENMYGEEGFGLYKYGYLEDIDKINNNIITEHYKKLVNEAKIDIYVSGNFDEIKLEKLLRKNLEKINPRKENIIINNFSTESKKIVEIPNKIQEEMNINQGKLVMGLDILKMDENMQYKAIIYNAILGNGANSMLFQNVREKAGLAYTARSTYNKMKNNIFISCGIEIKNFEKATDIIKEQLNNLKNGKFTDSDLQNAKQFIISGIKTIETEQDTEIVFYIGQEISKIKMSIGEYIKNIENITKDDVLEVANNLQINTIFFLKGIEC